MKKRLTAIILMLAFFTTTALAATTYQKTITVDYGINLDINGYTPSLTDVNGNAVQAFTYNGTTYVPLRTVADNMGASVGYFSDTKTAQIWQDDKEAMYAAYQIYSVANAIDGRLRSMVGLVALSTAEEKASSRDAVSASISDINTFYSNATSIYQLLIDNNNIYASTIQSCMNSLKDDYSAFQKAADAANLYLSSGSSTALSRFQTYVIDYGLYSNCAHQVDLFFESMW